jgi:3-phenylpropionate/cinnamic acid dioxygenase small subunit
VIGVPPSDWDAFLEIYDRACEAMYGHDTTAEAQVATRTPEQLGVDLDALTRIVNDAKERAKKCQEAQSKRGSGRRKGVELLR